jgi:hypothetical protein
MGRVAIEHYLYLLDQAFEPGGHPEHALLLNLQSVRDDEWFALPQSGRRTIFDIASHVGQCKYVYENFAFGDRTMRWDRPGSVPMVARSASPAEIIDWVSAGQLRMRASVESLADDAELLRPRMAPWGQEFETRFLINTIIQHDLYHGGEINHLRALHQGNDRWAFEEDES